jgi:ankyrin repeat protein
MTSSRFIMVFLLSLLVDAGIGCARRSTDSANPDTALLLAARKGDTASLQRLLRAGADVEAKDQGGSTALAVAANYGHPDAVKLLLENGADPVAGGLNGETALVDAARLANANKVELLLDRGADLRLKNQALFAVGESEPPMLEAAPGGAAKQVTANNSKRLTMAQPDFP